MPEEMEVGNVSKRLPPPGPQFLTFLLRIRPSLRNWAGRLICNGREEWRDVLFVVVVTASSDSLH